MENILSFSSSLVPFIQNNDSTRIQMASNQMIQSLPLINDEIAFVQTGNEQLFYNMFSLISEKSGKILEKTFYTMLIEYDDGEIKSYNINWRTKVFFDIGQHFEENEIIAADLSIKYDNIVFGKNLLTFVMPWYGYNYEDSIVINERLVNDKEYELTSIHSDTVEIQLHQNDVLLSLSDEPDLYKPLPEIGDFIKKNQPFLIKKLVDYGNIETFFDEPEKKYLDKDVYIYDIKIFPNNWNKSIAEFDLFIRNYINNINNYLKKFLEKNKKIDKNDLLRYIYSNRLDICKYVDEKTGTGKFKNKKEEFNGIIIKISYLYLSNIMVGDKLSNRHGNKGIISKIVPDNEMPRLEDGRTADIIINPLGIISRMNLGQLFELSCGMVVYETRKKLLNLFENKKYNEIKDFIIKLISILDNTKDNWYLQQTKYNLDNIFDDEIDIDSLKKLIENFYILQSPFESSSAQQLKEAMDFIGVKEEYLIYDPISKQYIKNPDGNHEGVTVGYMYWEKLRHVVIEKYAARSVSGYSNKYMQPLGGRKNKGGQRFGEMETWCLAGYDCLNNLDEMISVKSDNIGKKYNYISDILDDINVNKRKLIDENSNDTETTRILKSYLNIMGIDIVKNQK